MTMSQNITQTQVLAPGAGPGLTDPMIPGPGATPDDPELVRGRRRRRPPTARTSLLAIAVLVAVSTLLLGPQAFPAGLRLRVGDRFESAYTSFVDNGAWFYQPIADQTTAVFDGILQSLTLIAAPILVVAVVCAIALFRSFALAGLAVATFGWLLLTQLWVPALETIAFMIVAVVISGLVGLALGLLGSGSARVASAVGVLVDAMQAYPAFAYMVPAVVLLGYGNTAALFVTVIWAAPPLARMTMVGLRNVSEDTIEAATAAGANRRQLLTGVRLPTARQSIFAGLNQTIMYAIAMATMAAMIGAEGLGAPVWTGLQRLAFGDALEGGIALVLVAILLDRVSAQREASDRPSPARRFSLRRAPSRRTVGILAVLVTGIVATVVLRGTWQNFADPPWDKPLSLRDPVGSLVTWLNTTFGGALEAFSSTVQLFGLNPLSEFFATVPWYVVVIATAAIGALTCGRIAAVLSAVGVMAIGLLGGWTSTAETLAVVTTAIVLVILIGVPTGILMSANDRFAQCLRPVLDIMQTMPIYLFVIPSVILLGIGEVAGVFATFIAAVPPVIRFTNAAMRGVDPEVVEAAVTFGATPGQVLRQVRLPLGLPTLLVGLNQAVLLALAMAVATAFIGSPGLGQDILTSIAQFNLALGVESGLAMFVLAVIADRFFRGAAGHLSAATETHEGN